MRHARQRCRWFLVTLALLTAVGNCFADTLLMDNGDRLSGDMTRIEKGKISLNTAYAGAIHIDAAKVRTLASGKLMTLAIDKTRHIYGTLSVNNGRLQIQPEDGSAPVDAATQDSAVVLPGRVTGREWKQSGHVDIGGSDRKGNSVGNRTRVDAELVLEREKFRVIAGTTVNHATDHGQEIESNVIAHAKYDRFLSPKQYGYGNVTLEHDKFQDIRLRYTIGAGRGFDVFASPQTNLSLEGGPSFVHTDFYSTTDNSYPALRLAVRFDHYLIPRRLQLFQQSEVFIGLDGLRKSFAHTKTGLRLPLRDNLIASLEYDVDWDGNPAAGSVSTDRTFVFSLGYHW